jgi:hypothetical protein
MQSKRILGYAGNGADTVGMRVLRDRPQEPLIRISLQLRPSTLKRLDEAAKQAKLPRQKLLGAILDQVLADKNFVLKVNE